MASENDDAGEVQLQKCSSLLSKSLWLCYVSFEEKCVGKRLWPRLHNLPWTLALTDRREGRIEGRSLKFRSIMAEHAVSDPPRPKLINNLVQPLLTDLYQITMCYAYWKAGKCREPAVFDLFFRKNPFGGEFTIFAGLEQCLAYLLEFRFSQSGETELQARLANTICNITQIL